MADAATYAKWLVDNQDKQGTPEFEVVSQAFKALQEKPSIGQRIIGAINPDREDYPEYRGGSDPEMALRTERKMGDPNAAIAADRFGNPIIETNRGTFYLDRPGPSRADISQILGGASRMAQEAAPYVATGAVTAPLRYGAQMLAQGATGLAQESINQAGRAAQGDDSQWSRLAITPLFAMAGDAAGRLAYRVAAPLVSKIAGSSPNIRIVNSDGTLTDDAINLLRSSGTSADDFAREAADQAASLQRTGVLTREQAERFNFMREMGLEPTTAQVTRSADDFQMQQELVKRSGAARNAIEQQEGIISGAFDNRIFGAGGVTSGSPVADAVLNRATALDDAISNLYNTTRQTIGNEKNVRLNRYAELLRSKAPDNELTGGLIRSLRGDLIERGVIDRNFNVTGRVDVDTAETIRQVINQRYKSTNDLGRMVIRDLKDALDDDVISVAGRDAFAEARRLRTEFGRAIMPERVSRFDTSDRSLVRSIMENDIKPENIFDQVVLGKSWASTDLNHLKRFLASSVPEQAEEGIKAWAGLRADALDWIKEASMNGPIDEFGNKALSRAGIERALKRIGDDKMKVIFTPEENIFLNNMMRLAELREPVRGTAMGRGPSAQAIDRLERSMMSKLPVVGQFADLVQALRLERAEAAAVSRMVSPAQQTIDALSTIGRGDRIIGQELIRRAPSSSMAGALGAYAGTQQQPTEVNQ